MLDPTSAENVAIVLERAIDLFGSEVTAAEWMDKKSATLGCSPRELAPTEEGKHRVLLHLSGISRHRFG